MKLVWNDPDPIEGNDYTVHTFDLLDEEEGIARITYGYGSEAEVYIHELEIKE